MSSSNRKKRLIFALLCVVSIVVVAGYVYFAKARMAPTARIVVAESQPLPASPMVAPVPKTVIESVTEPVPVPAKLIPTVEKPPAPVAAHRIFFRHNAVDNDYGKLAFVEDGQVDQFKLAGGLSCEAVYAASGRGICLQAKRGVFTTYEAQLFDATTFEGAKRVPLAGVPSRCRISADGKLAAYTVFVTGHSYDSADFSTQTVILNAVTGEVLGELEKFEVTRDDQPFKATDFNFWGVTFTPDGKNFYCTLSSNRQHYLVKGNIASRTAKVIHEQVECPSLSPDGTRIAYKKRFIINSRLIWRLHILNLQTDRETELKEERSVDDQLEWLDTRHVLYSLPANETGASASTNVWVVAADGSKAPTLFLKNAYSPAVER